MRIAQERSVYVICPFVCPEKALDVDSKGKSNPEEYAVSRTPVDDAELSFESKPFVKECKCSRTELTTTDVYRE